MKYLFIPIVIIGGFLASKYQIEKPIRVDSMRAQLPNECQQCIHVHLEPGLPFQARIHAEERVGDVWKSYTEAPATVGRNGIALASMKREGDGKTPAGIYPLKQAFGYDHACETKMLYTPVEEDDLWIDDPEAMDYNRWVKQPTKAKSFEKLYRDDDCYRWSVVIEYNTAPVIPFRGSAIFLHVWSGSNKPTAGCVAVSADVMQELLRWLDPMKYPTIFIHNP